MTGDVPTWEEVARTHGRFLYNVAYRLTGNDDDAFDLVQEALLRVRKGLETYRPGSMEAWLSRIVTNVFLDEVRRKRRRPVEVLPEDPERVVSRGPSPEQAVADAGLEGDIEQALMALQPEFRAAVVLCDLEGLTYEEIALTLGIKVGTVRSRIHRGRRLLREALG